MSVSRTNSAFATGDNNQILNSQQEVISSLLLSIDGSSGRKSTLLDGSTAGSFRIAPVNQTTMAHQLVCASDGSANWNFSSGGIAFGLQSLFYPTATTLRVGNSSNSTLFNITIDTNDAGALTFSEDGSAYAVLNSTSLNDSLGNIIIQWGASKQLGNASYPLNSSQLKVAGTKVVGAQGVAIADATVLLTSVTTQLNLLLAACRTHGLIAT